MTSPSFAYDVFVVHSDRDRDLVDDLTTRLLADGLRIWEASVPPSPGAEAVTADAGLLMSRVLVLVLSANTVSSDWPAIERTTMIFRDMESNGRRFIPLLADDTSIPSSIEKFACVDWRIPSEEEYLRLVRACSPLKQWDTRPVLLPAKVLRSTKGPLLAVAITPDGKRIVSGSTDKNLHVWDSSHDSVGVLSGHEDEVTAVSLTADGTLAASASLDGTIRLWNLTSSKSTATVAHNLSDVHAVSMTPNGLLIASGGSDGLVHVWDTRPAAGFTSLKGHRRGVRAVALAADGRHVVSGSDDTTLRVWALPLGECVATLEGHNAAINDVTVSSDSRIALSAGNDRTVRVWSLQSFRCHGVLEGHESAVTGVAVSADGRWAVSCSRDLTCRLWSLRSGDCLAVLRGHGDELTRIAMTADGLVAVSASKDATLCVWDLTSITQSGLGRSRDLRYTNAKVLLVGDSGVGKTGLAQRLTLDTFVPAASTDGAWASQLKLAQEAVVGDLDREIWLWDFAGQADYRLIHQLFLDETALAILVFNPQSHDPLDPLAQWDRDLQRAARRPFRKLLVAGRCDRGGLTVSRDVIDRFCAERGFVRYLETSAQTTAGCDALRSAIIENIDWEHMAWTASPRIFRLLKSVIVRMKEGGRVLLRIAELKQHIEMQLPREPFSLGELRSVLGLLAGPGVVWTLDFGDFVLLQPEVINAYAAAVIRSVRAHTDEIGCILEERVRTGDLDYQDMKRLPPSDEQIVRLAMLQTFVDYGLCFREATAKGHLLVFPSYFKRERPPLEGHPAAFVSYRFGGALEEIYATLVVQLCYALAFELDQLWRFAADFRTPEGKRLGLKLVRLGEGEAEITVYLDPQIPDDSKVTFVRYVHEHLIRKDPVLKRTRHYVCGHCEAPVENERVVADRLKRGEKDIVCANCERRVVLFDLLEQKFTSDESRQRVLLLEDRSRARLDNESKELILVGHAFAIAGEAGQIFRPTANSDWGIDGEIEFKDHNGNASGRRVYLQLKSGDSCLRRRKRDGEEVFDIRSHRHSKYWQDQAYPVMLVIRTSDGSIRWMDLSAYLSRERQASKGPPRTVTFRGEPFTALSLRRLRDQFIPPQISPPTGA